MVSIAGLVFDSARIDDRIVETSSRIVGDAGADVVQRVLDSSHEPATNVLTFAVSFLVLMFGASRVFLQLQDGMRAIWETGGHSLVRGTILDRLVGLVMVLGAGAVFVLGLTAQAALASVGAVLGSRWVALQPLLTATDWALAFIVIAIVLAVMFRYVPRIKVPWRAVIPGTLLTTVLFLTGRFLFGLYLNLGFGSSLQGAAGSLVVFVIWIFYLAQIVFFGVEFTRALTRVRGSPG